jgi:hypothetical protein
METASVAGSGAGAARTLVAERRVATMANFMFAVWGFCERERWEIERWFGLLGWLKIDVMEK